jgi:hypothetical protein
MKKYIIYFSVALFLFSCKRENDRIFDQSPDQRLNEALAAYEGQLSSAQNGWKGLLRTNGGNGSVHSFFFKFNNANRVVMLSDFDSLSAVTMKESSYRLKALQQPSLIFDTYSYLHVLADPDESVNGGTRGEGLLSDFEFYFDYGSSADTIFLTGRINSSKLTLVKATAAEEQAYINGQLAAGLILNKILTYFKRLTIGSQLYDVQIDPVNRTFTFSWLDGSGVLQTFTTNYYYILGGIVFATPFVNGSQTITGFTNMSWDQSTETINLTAGGAAGTVRGIVVPLKVDVGAPRRWWDYAIANGNSFWISLEGFHVNGVDDAFGIQTLPRYYFLAYWPEYDPGNDLFGPVFINAAGTGLELQYATAPRPNFTADGRLVFQYLGDYGPYPNTGPSGLSRVQLYNSSGYYFVQTSETTYDMVSAANGKAWITWEF